MATFKCNDPVYTVLRNGRVISMPTTPSNAIDIIVADAANVVCSPECCITAVTWDGVEFFATINTATAIGMWIRAYDDDGNEYTEWQHITSGSTVIDMSAFGEPSSGDEYCFEFSYNQVDIVTDTCCFEVQTATFEEADTYDLIDMVDVCTGGVFTLLTQTPASGITLSAAGELVIPALADSATLTATYGCNGCIVNFLIITASNVSVPCCIEALDYDADTFEVTVTNTDAVGWYVRVNLNDSDQTAWALSDGDDTIDLSGLTNAFEDGDLYCVEYTEDPEADPIVIVPGSCCFTVRADTYLEDATYDVSGLVDPCEGGTFDLLYQNPAMGVTLDAAGEMVVPDLDEDGTVYGTFTCDGCVTDFLVLSVDNVTALRLGFDDIDNVPVADPSSVSDWNTFFDLPTNGTPFASVIVYGNEVKLIGGGNLIVKDSAFQSSTAINYVIDETGVIIEVGYASFYDVTMSEFTANSMIGTRVVSFGGNSTITTFNALALENAGQGTFNGLVCTTFNAPNIVTMGLQCLQSSTIAGAYIFNNLSTIGDSCFDGASNITSLIMPILTALGSTVADNFVFNVMTALTAVTVPIALATADAGNPDGDLVFAAGTLGATITYV